MNFRTFVIVCMSLPFRGHHAATEIALSGDGIADANEGLRFPGVFRFEE